MFAKSTNKSTDSKQEVIEMFGAIIGVAAKFIGGAVASGGAGKLLGGIGGGGLLSSLGNLIKGGPLKEIFDMVSNFKSNFLGGASQQPPLGNFGQDNGASAANGGKSAAQARLLERIEGLLSRLEKLRGGQNGNQQDGCRCDSSNGIDRIRELLRQLIGSGNDQNQASIQFSRSQYFNIQA